MMTRRALLLIVPFVVVFVADFATKYWAMRDLAFYPAVPVTLGEFTWPSPEAREAYANTTVRRVPVLPGWFDLFLQHNTGGAFSVMNERPLLLAAISLIAMAWLALWSLKLPPNANAARICFGLILGGAVGNLVDRLRLGYVVDFLHFYRDEWYWPTFNIADSAIVVGIGIFVYLNLFTKQLDTPGTETATPAADGTPDTPPEP